MTIYKHQVFCSPTEYLNEDIAEEQKEGWIPTDLSCVRMETGTRDITCCLLFKKTITVVGEEEWIPEPKAIWKEKKQS